MLKLKNIIFTILFSVLLTGCGGSGGGGGGGNGGTVKPAPSSLTAVYNSGNIDLAWTAASGSVTYRVYRSGDYGASFSMINSADITGTNFTDTAPPDGIYYYFVTALGTSESAPSNIAKNAAGTRLNPSYSSGCNLGKTTSNPGGVYVVEGSVAVNGGHLEIQSDATLIVLDNAIIDIENTRKIFVDGLLRVEASMENPATFTSHKTGGLADTEGFYIEFSGNSADYDEATGSGCMLRNSVINSLGTNADSIRISECSPALNNLKITVNSSNGTGHLILESGAGLIMKKCSLANIVPVFRGTVSSDLKIEFNIFSGGYYPLLFEIADPGLTSSQLINNRIDCSGGDGRIYVSAIAGSGTINIGENYWPGGTGIPPIPGLSNFSSWSVNISVPLTGTPSGAGTGW